MTHLPPFFLCLAGFTCLALAMNRQQKALFGRALTRAATRAMRISGACALLLAFGILLARQGWGLGPVIYSGHTSLAAGIVYCALIVHARHTARSF
ncbi:MAG: DUF3325 domain-containing protein [Burkholderiales bacterium]|nr:DUF3325 domain-containing protein [Burkholderiales bacterium]